MKPGFFFFFFFFLNPCLGPVALIAHGRAYPIIIYFCEIYLVRGHLHPLSFTLHYWCVRRLIWRLWREFAMVGCVCTLEALCSSSPKPASRRLPSVLPYPAAPVSHRLPLAPTLSLFSPVPLPTCTPLVPLSASWRSRPPSPSFPIMSQLRISPAAWASRSLCVP